MWEWVEFSDTKIAGSAFPFCTMVTGTVCNICTTGTRQELMYTERTESDKKVQNL